MKQVRARVRVPVLARVPHGMANPCTTLYQPLQLVASGTRPRDPAAAPACNVAYPTNGVVAARPRQRDSSHKGCSMRARGLNRRRANVTVAPPCRRGPPPLVHAQHVAEAPRGATMALLCHPCRPPAALTLVLALALVVVVVVVVVVVLVWRWDSAPVPTAQSSVLHLPKRLARPVVCTVGRVGVIVAVLGVDRGIAHVHRPPLRRHWKHVPSPTPLHVCVGLVHPWSWALPLEDVGTYFCARIKTMVSLKTW